MMPPGQSSHSQRQPILVGREREQTILRDALVAALAGRGGLVLIGGEAGIGKTALAEHLLSEAEQRGALQLIGRCYDLSETPPHGPWAEALARAPQHGGKVAPPDLDGLDAASQSALFASVRDYLVALSANQPLVILLDDLHWADPASLDLLRFLGRQLASLPVLLLATYRADELTRRHPLYQLLPTLEREARASRLDLRPLGETALHALVAHYALPAGDAARLAAWLHGRAEGNAFFVTQLLRALEDEGVLQRAGDDWRLGDLAAVGLPAPLRQVLDTRLGRLGEEDHRLLILAAVIGQEVRLSLWTAVAKTDEEVVLNAVDAAMGVHLLDVAPDGASVRFAHALIREALYEGLVATRRRRVHRQVAEALLGTGDPDPDAVAEHLRRAGDERAVTWLVQAGERAQRAYAWRTAAARYDTALALLGEGSAASAERAGVLYRHACLVHDTEPRRAIALLDEAIRLADVGGDQALLTYGLCEQGRLHCLAGEYLRGLAELRRGIAALEVLPDSARARLTALTAALGIGFDPVGHLVVWLAVLGYNAEARAVGEQALARLSAAPGPDDLAFAHGSWGLAWAYGWLGQPERAQWAFARARTAMLAVGEQARAGSATAVELDFVVLPYLADQAAEREHIAAEAERLWTVAGDFLDGLPPRLARLPLLVLEGSWDEARALAMAGRAGRIPLSRHLARRALGPLARAQGDPSLAWALVREALPAGSGTAPGESGFFEAVTLQVVAALMALETGDLTTARAWLEANDRWLAWGDAVLGRAEWHLGWAAYHRAVGDNAASREHAEAALAHATEPRQPVALLAAHRTLGELATETRSYDDAATNLDAALSLAEACVAPYERALTLLALAELRTATDQQSAAQDLLTEARALLKPLGARPALARADTLAAQLAAATAGPAALPFGLTAREVEVLRLVAQGLTDAQAAERLYVSTNTVKTHLRSIYTKLDVPSRTAAARFASDHGIA